MPEAANRGFIFDGPEYANINPRIISAILNFQDSTRLSGVITHESWVLDYPVDDYGLCLAGRSGKKWLPRTPGVAHLYRPGTPYREDTRGCKVPLRSRYIIFRGGEFAGLDKFTGNRPGFARIYDPEGLLGDILYNIASSPGGNERSFWETQSIFFSVIELLHRRAGKMKDTDNCWIISAKEIKSEEELFVEKANSFLKSSIGRYVELGDIAKSLNVSPSTLSHRYKELTGRSPLDTLLTMRINAAKALLIRGEKLKNVASLTGFYDEFHFSKTFRKRTGLPPRKFIRSITAK